MTNQEAIKVLTEINYNSIENDTVVATNMAIKALEQEPKLRQALEQEKGAYNALVKNIQCADAISREWLKTAIHNFYYGLKHTPTEEDIQAYINYAPPVNPQEPKTGHREYNDIYDHYLCGNCKTIVMDYDNFCPNCGARMVEPQESEDKE